MTANRIACQSSSSVLLAMLTRRVFRQLTDLAILDAPLTPLCLSSRRLPRQRPQPHVSTPATVQISRSGSSSSARWQNRQSRDHFVRDAKVKGLMSRAAFKLLEIDAAHKIFKPDQTVVDLVRSSLSLAFIHDD